MGNAKKAGDRKLVVLSGRAKGTEFVLTKSKVEAGRESDNAICLKGKRVSRHHAVLIRDNGEYTLRDMSPRIGTLLNGRRTKEAHLKVGDRIRIGEFEMRYEATTASMMGTPSAMIPVSPEEVMASVMPVATAQGEPVVELAVENSSREYEQRIVELTERLDSMSQENGALAKANGELQAKISEGAMSLEEVRRAEAKLAEETKELVDEAKKANEVMESLRAQMQTRSDQQAELMERFTIVSQENSGLAKRNDELQTKISKLEASAAKVDRMEIELATAQEALHKMGEELAEARELIKQNGNTEPADREEIPLSSFERVVAAEPIALDQRNKIMDPSAPIEPMAVDSDEARMTAAKKQEEVVARREVSEKTHEQFDSLRRTIVEKKNLRARMTLFERFTLPFRDTARLVQEQDSTSPE